MSDDELGPLPTPESETPQKFPGGADNLADPEKYGDRGTLDAPALRDLDPSRNPAVEEAATTEIGEADDKQQEPDDGAEDQEAGARENVSAGQEDEHGDPEAPA